jgi:HAE1 family hydrophobic/amphiphilic exporter-1
MKRLFSISLSTTPALAIAALVMSGGVATAQSDQAAPADHDQPALSLTLDEAVRRAVEKNPDLAIVRLDTEVEAARVGESRGAFTPVFSTVLGRSNSATPPVNLLLGDRGVSVGDLFSSTGVRQRVPWGAGTWSLSWNSSRTTTDAAISSFDPSVQSGFQLAFSQPLFRDRAIDASRQQYIVAKRNQASSELRFREALVRTVATVKLAYWTLKASNANVTVQQRSLELAEQLARENRVRVKAGQMASLDVVQAEAEVAQRREGLIRARTGAEDAEDALRRLIIDPGDPSLWSVRLDPADDPAPAAPPPDVDQAVATALNERYDLARANQDLENSRTTVAYLQNQRLPDVRLETSYGAAGLAGTQFLRTGGFPGSVTGTRDIGFGNALNQVFSNDFPTWSFGLTVSYPIGHSYETASLARAQVEHRQTEQRIASLRIDTAQAVRRAARQIRGAAERVDAARAGETLAEQRTDAEQRRYQVGLSTTFLVTQAQRDLLEAQVNLLQTLLDYQSAVVSFEAVQRAAPNGAGPLAIQGAEIVQLPTSTPAGIFRPGASTGF